VDKVFLQNLEAAGYERVVQGFVNEFAGQVPWFQEVLGALSYELGEQLKVEFSATDKRFFVGQQVSTVAALESEIERGAIVAKRQALFSVGGLPVKQLTEYLATAFRVSLSDATSLASTALPTFYRTVADRGFQKIEQGLAPGRSVRYTYYGPLDKLNRPFCRRMMGEAKAGKAWTREEIAKLSNGSLPNVFATCGGWRCRHQWLVSNIFKNLKGVTE
jgi:hypothetical protein